MIAHLRLASLSLLLVLPAAMARGDDAFQPLFDGQSLAGWSGDPELWQVADGAIVGSTDAKTIPHNSFLSLKKPYANFVLRLKFKLRNHNSGVQFRSRQHDDHVVRGYQADIAEAVFMGILYEEGGRGILAKPQDAAEVYRHVEKDDWNEYVIAADGPRITQSINGFTTIDYREESPEGAKSGIIALQLHAGPKMKVAFKDLEIKELP